MDLGTLVMGGSRSGERHGARTGLSRSKDSAARCGFRLGAGATAEVYSMYGSQAKRCSRRNAARSPG